jgi:hypothetical protein
MMGTQRAQHLLWVAVCFVAAYCHPSEICEEMLSAMSIRVKV